MEWSGGHFRQFGGIFGVSGKREINKNFLIRSSEVIWSGLEAKKIIFGIFGIFGIFVILIFGIFVIFVVFGF